MPSVAGASQVVRCQPASTVTRCHFDPKNGLHRLESLLSNGGEGNPDICVISKSGPHQIGSCETSEDHSGRDVFRDADDIADLRNRFMNCGDVPLQIEENGQF